jgi:hypothetical protein
VYFVQKMFSLQVPFLFGVTAFEQAANLLIHWIFKRTGRHLFLNDDDEGKPPLLKRMIEDYGDCFFMYATYTAVLYADSFLL